VVTLGFTQSSERSEMTTYSLSTTGAPTGGSFLLNISTGPTNALRTYPATIQWNSTAAQAKAALESLPNLKDGAVAAAGGPLPATPITLQFEGMLKETPQVVAVGTNSLTGGTTPAPAVSEDTTKRHDLPGRNDTGKVATRASGGAWGN